MNKATWRYCRRNRQGRDDVLEVQQLCNISKSPPDHQFFHDQFYPDENIFINKEWKTLEANLPDSIYIRAYKSRQDLMRAVIVGPKGTSYSHVCSSLTYSFQAIIRLSLQSSSTILMALM